MDQSILQDYYWDDPPTKRARIYKRDSAAPIAHGSEASGTAPNHRSAMNAPRGLPLPSTGHRPAATSAMSKKSRMRRKNTVSGPATGRSPSTTGPPKSDFTALWEAEQREDELKRQALKGPARQAPSPTDSPAANITSGKRNRDAQPPDDAAQLSAELEVMRTRLEVSKTEVRTYEEKIRDLTRRALTAERKLRDSESGRERAEASASAAAQRVLRTESELESVRLRAEKAEQRADEAEERAEEAEKRAEEAELREQWAAYEKAQAEKRAADLEEAADRHRLVYTEDRCRVAEALVKVCEARHGGVGVEEEPAEAKPTLSATPAHSHFDVKPMVDDVKPCID